MQLVLEHLTFKDALTIIFILFSFEKPLLPFDNIITLMSYVLAALAKQSCRSIRMLQR